MALAQPGDNQPQHEESPSPASAVNTTDNNVSGATTSATQISSASEQATPVAASGTPSSLTADQKQQPTKATAEDDEDDESDFDELDDVLDNFSKPQSSSTGPSKSDAQPPIATTSTDGFDEEAFLKQLEQDMAKMMGQAAHQPGASDDQAFANTLDEGADAFTKQLEESGVPPEDFLKQLLADVLAEENGKAPSGSSAGAAVGDGDAPDSFNDAIQRTINRMKESGDKATAAAADDDISGDLIAQLLKAVEAGAGGAGDDGDDEGITKMFMGMMEQLSTKEILYEAMKEFDTKFGPWIEENKAKGTVSDEDMKRYESQAKIVSDIVGKFEEESYSDEDPKCREFIWEKMQEMQAAGNPPEEIFENPLDGLTGPGAGAPPDCPQQ